MTGPPLLHNMSVPPRSTVRVRRLSLPGPCYLVDLGAIRSRDAAALWTGGAEAALRLLHSAKGFRGAAARRRQWKNPTRRFRERMREALRRAGIPDRVGIFVSAEHGREAATRVPFDAAMALLSRRSGPLYLPRRAFTPSLVVPARVVVVFPEP